MVAPLNPSDFKCLFGNKVSLFYPYIGFPLPASHYLMRESFSFMLLAFLHRGTPVHFFGGSPFNEFGVPLHFSLPPGIGKRMRSGGIVSAV